jgi:DNA-binding response OmpR family regulator
LVEDDEQLASVLEGGLREQKIDVSRARTIAEARSRARLGSFEILVLDALLPGGNGFDLCRDLRRGGDATPILMLTAQDTVDDRVRGLDAGADDYLTKPFEFRELLARIRALTRRRPALTPSVVHIADLCVDLDARRVTRAGKDLDLTAKEFELLSFFVQHPGRVVDRAAITAHVWDDNHDPFTNVLEVLVSRLRRKVDGGHDVRLIHTLRGAGYRFGP